jgi:hypothetical protein
MRLLVRIDPDRHHLLVPSLDADEADSRRTFFSRGDATLLSGHAGTSLTATGDTLGIGQPTGDQLSESQPEAVKDNPPRAHKAQRLNSFALKTHH